VGSGRRCDHWCQVLWKSVKGFRSYSPPQRPFPIAYLTFIGLTTVSALRACGRDETSGASQSDSCRHRVSTSDADSTSSSYTPHSTLVSTPIATHATDTTQGWTPFLFSRFGCYIACISCVEKVSKDGENGCVERTVGHGQWLPFLYLVGTACAQWKIGEESFVKGNTQNFRLIFHFTLVTKLLLREEQSPNEGGRLRNLS